VPSCRPYRHRSSATGKVRRLLLQPHPQLLGIALAARRLALVAEIFQSTTERFLRHSATAAPDLAVDLGCGPGHTTQLLNAIVRPRRTIAVDSSTAFIELAAGGSGKPPRCSALMCLTYPKQSQRST
jgi:SAM-dependent methyltransferase